jgi:DNA-binding NarL/FixJ family response regulator
MGMPQLRLIVAADSALLRAGLARLLDDAGFDVVATARCGEELSRKTRAYRPDVAIASLDEVPERLVPTLIIAQSVDHERALALLDDTPSGIGYLLEHRIPDVGRFVSAIRQVAAGGVVLDPAVVAEVLSGRANRDTLTEREREVLTLMAQGRSNRAIAATAYLSERAVERHVTSIFGKLDLPTGPRTHRRVLAVRHHLSMARSPARGSGAARAAGTPA